jgi:hypothetical protein
MDFTLPIVELDQKNYEQYVKALKESNCPETIRWELLDLLLTALKQTKQAKTIGWL